MIELYHYTNDQNVNSILASHNLRATISTQSNDSTDTTYLKQILLDESKDMLFQITKIGNKNQDDRISLELLIGKMEEIFTEACEERKSKFNASALREKCFVICFTTKRDDRFLWTSYTNDQGCCFKFEYNQLNDFISQTLITSHNSHELKSHIFSQISKPSFLRYKFSKVLYDKMDQCSEVKKILKINWNKHSKSMHELSNISVVSNQIITFTDEKGNVIDNIHLKPKKLIIRQWVIDFMQSIVNELLDLAPFIKHPYWTAEDEYRLVLYRPFYSDVLNTIKYNPYKKQYYINFNFDQLLLQEVIISPKSISSVSQLNTYNTMGYSFVALPSVGTGVLQ